MARIPEYEGPERTLTTSDKGASAFEQAGRRIGPAYNEAATFIRQGAEAATQAGDLVAASNERLGKAKEATAVADIRMRRWPFDMLELEKSIEAQRSGAGAAGGGMGIKLEGKVNDLVNFNDKIDNADGTTRGRGRTSRNGNDVGGTSLAAAGMAKVAAAMAKGNQYRNSEIVNGIDILDPRNKAKGKQYDTVLDHGHLRYIDRATGQESKITADDIKYGTGPNADAAKQADDAAKGAISQQNQADWTQKFGYNPATGEWKGGNNTTGWGGNGTTKDTISSWGPTDSGGGQDAPGTPGTYVYPTEGGGSTIGPQSDAMPQGMTPSAVNDVQDVVNTMQTAFGTGDQQDYSVGGDNQEAA